MKQTLALIAAIFLCIILHAQNADTKLSNLVAPTQINQHLLPKSNNTKNLGSAAASWRNIYADSIIYLDDVPFVFNKNDNVLIGQNAALNNTTGDANSALGNRAMYNITTGSNNTALGHRSLYSNKIGFNNVAIGPFALYHSTSKNNHAIGYEALYENSTGESNIAIGYQSLTHNISGSSNVAIGEQALFSNSTSSGLVAIGDSSLYSNTTGVLNTAVGYRSLLLNKTGNRNTGIGYEALKNNISGNYNTADGISALGNNTTGSYNTANGFFSLALNTTANDNTAYGSNTLENNTNGSGNTAIGLGALRLNTTGSSNCAFGKNALYSNAGSGNIAVGYEALKNNTSSYNIAVGTSALKSITNGLSNIAIGTGACIYATNLYGAIAIGDSTLSKSQTGNGNLAIGGRALYENTIGTGNVTVGASGLHRNTTGSYNTTIGVQTLVNNTKGSGNAAIGYLAMPGATGDNNCAVGYSSLHMDSAGSGNIGIGYYTNGNHHAIIENCTMVGFSSGGIDGSFENSSCFGYSAQFTASDQVRIGHTFVSSIGGYKDWSKISDGRYKKNIKEDVKGIDFIRLLKPVTYNLDVSGLNNFLGNKDSANSTRRIAAEKEIESGFIAQDVEAAAKKIGYNFSGVDKPKNEHDLYSLRYAEFVVPLVKAVQELDVENTQLKSTLSYVLAQLSDIKNQLNDLKASQQQCCAQCISNNQNTDAQTISLSQASLEQNSPNPFNSTTVIRYYIPSSIKQASLVITTTSGQTLKSILLNDRGSGQITISSGALAAGNYLFILIFDGKTTAAKQMTLTK
jgi:hypothetical protein